MTAHSLNMTHRMGGDGHGPYIMAAASCAMVDRTGGCNTASGCVRSKDRHQELRLGIRVYAVQSSTPGAAVAAQFRACTLPNKLHAYSVCVCASSAGP
jgi:hypothetical protein